MILNQGLFNVESNCVPAGFIKFVVLHSFVIMIFAFANNVQIVLYLYSRRLERTRNTFKKDIQRHSKENIHLKCCNCKIFYGQ